MTNAITLVILEKFGAEIINEVEVENEEVGLKKSKIYLVKLGLSGKMKGYLPLL